MTVPRAQIEAQVQAALAFACEESADAGAASAEVDLSADFESLGLDSVGRVELLARLEDSFELHVPPDDAIHLNTGRDVVRYLARRLT
jgi:acyl carrier protein